MAQLLTALKINEVSSVTRGAGEGVQIVMMKREDGISKDYVQEWSGDAAIDAYMKREFSDEKRKEDAKSGAAMPGGGYPIENTGDLENAIRAIGRAKDPAATKRHIISRARALGASDKIPEDWRGGKLAKSIRAIFKAKGHPTAADPDGDGDDDTTLDPKKNPDVLEDIAEGTLRLKKSVESIIGDAALTSDARMAAVTETFKQFSDHINGIVPASIAKTIDSLIVKKENDMTPEEKKKHEEEMKREEEKAEKLRKRLVAISKLDQTEHAYFTNLLAKAKDGYKVIAEDAEENEDCLKFLKKTLEERRAEMKEKEEETKKALNDSLPPEVKKALEVAKVNEERLAKLEKVQKLDEFKKRAVGLGLPESQGALLMKAHEGDVASIEKLENIIKGLYNQIETGALFKEYGSNVSDGSGSAYEQLLAKAEELRVKDGKITKEQAFAKIYQDPANKALADQYKKETTPRVIAA